MRERNPTLRALSSLNHPRSRHFSSPQSKSMLDKMKSVCIVGAGPGGLVAAKTLLETRQFHVTIYEQYDGLGGLWRFDEGAGGNFYLGTSIPTNLSRYTVAFSDLAWESVPLRDAKLPMFPRASQVGEYLREYRRRYIPDDVLQYGRRVTAVELVNEDNGERWEVKTATRTREEVAVFDHLVCAAGFFSKPRDLDVRLSSHTKTTAIHSSAFKTLSDLFPDSLANVRDTRILVLGGGNSGGEAAASVAFQLSSARHSPLGTGNDRYKGVTITHLITRPFYAIPPYIPSSPAPTFAPLDLQFYDLKWQPTNAVITSSSGRLQPDAIKARHQAIHGMVGDQTDLQSHALHTPKDAEARAAPYAALSETYPEFVRMGSIFPYLARLSSTHTESSRPWLTAQIKGLGDETITVQDVSAIIYANGYTPSAALSFLPDDIKNKLEFDPTSARIPVLLQNWQTMNPSVPTLGFIGFYEGPYWGIMEMQARILAKLWANEAEQEQHHKMPPLPSEALPTLRSLRTAMKEKASNVPQYWFSDYVAYLEELCRYLKLERNDSPFLDERDGPVNPSRYLSPTATAVSRQEAKHTMQSFYDTSAASRAGRFRARVAFRGLQGFWQLDRTLKSERSEMPSGRFSGEAWFHPRLPTDPAFDGEHLYIEHGTFQTDSGIQMKATRRYIYRYNEQRDELSVWFVKVEDGLTADYLFHVLDFAPVPQHGDDTGAADAISPRLTARADHLCEQDMYRTVYNIGMSTVRLIDIEIRHSVRGPSKNYVAVSKYKR